MLKLVSLEELLLRSKNQMMNFNPKIKTQSIES